MFCPKKQPKKVANMKEGNMCFAKKKKKKPKKEWLT
jgi:hypothetical protein